MPLFNEEFENATFDARGRKILAILTLAGDMLPSFRKGGYWELQRTISGVVRKQVPVRTNGMWSSQTESVKTSYIEEVEVKNVWVLYEGDRWA